MCNRALTEVRLRDRFEHMLKSSENSTTREKILSAALESIRKDGFAGTSARAIARRGAFNQALIFYHFGTLNDLLLACLDRTSEERMERYKELLAESETLPGLISSATDAYREDLAAGHITVLSELIAGSLAYPDLRGPILERMEPWLDFAEGVVDRFLKGTPFQGVIPPHTAALAVVALYLGIDLIAHLDRDHTRTESLFAAARSLGSALKSFGV